MTRVLMVSTDVVGPSMAGPGIRALELARVLARTHEVTLAIPEGSRPSSLPYAVVAYQPGRAGDLAAAVADTEVIVGQGFVFSRHPELLAASQPIAIDLYDPQILESLHLVRQVDPVTAAIEAQGFVARTRAQLERGDFFFCATAVQRDYWLGALSVLGRMTPTLVAEADDDLRSLIDLVPSGLDPQPPRRDQPVLRGVHPAIPEDAFLLIWAGGLWDWFDPQLVVRAVAQLRETCPQLRLCFFAGARPNPDGPPIVTPEGLAVRELAAHLGVLNETVIMLDTWVPYAERGRYLSEADVGVSAHMPGIETHFAFRTRLLDYLWARLPIVCSLGDSLGEQIAQAGGAICVAPYDLDGWCAALHQLYHDRAQCRAMAASSDGVACTFTWDAVAQPLVAFCDAPRRTAPDHGATERPAPVGLDPQVLVAKQAQLVALDHYARQLDAALNQKNQHIAHLERHIERIEMGRVMRLLKLLTRQR
ncbi:glycosyltransferase family 4 protein [Candidatus Chloroploca sp. Khr17]|uniref:glycosyltransferase family 4 protein n=1 Tax=Candidatus Chloroploca sp. Khr17 TaxID=2496869 RepID=UPI00101CD45F|nr:glycosyltransferase family 4 protein [Candidatus Chloroploca sp. Khr17]